VDVQEVTADVDVVITAGTTGGLAAQWTASASQRGATGPGFIFIGSSFSNGSSGGIKGIVLFWW
jgi:hypothetical protein